MFEKCYILIQRPSSRINAKGEKKIRKITLAIGIKIWKGCIRDLMPAKTRKDELRNSIRQSLVIHDRHLPHQKLIRLSMMHVIQSTRMFVVSSMNIMMSPMMNTLSTNFILYAYMNTIIIVTGTNAIRNLKNHSNCESEHM